MCMHGARFAAKCTPTHGDFMKLKSTLAYLLGSAAAGGALYYGLSRRQRATPASGRSGRERLLVRVTENGRKYHRDNCQLLHGDSRVITVAEALQHYEPCKACHPPSGLDDADDTTHRGSNAPIADAAIGQHYAPDGREQTPPASPGNASTIDASSAIEDAASSGVEPARINDAVGVAAPTGIESDPVGESVQRGIER